jgi:hypothetical protein
MNEPKQVALLPEPTNLNPLQLVQIAIQKGVDAEQLKELMQLQREWKADQARDAFVAAMNGFRAEALKVIKTKQVSYGNTNYKHATLANIVELAAPALSRHGLSHRWETTQDGGLVTVACVITHQFGHSERTALSSAPDTSGAKNAIQAVGSAVTYLQRYTFMAITGLAAQDQDNDGGQPLEFVSEKQVADLDALIEDVGANKAAFLKVCKVEALDHILAKNYTDAVKRLEAKRRG